MQEDSKIPTFFLAVIGISFTVLGTASIMHIHEFSKQESSWQESNSKISQLI